MVATILPVLQKNHTTTLTTSSISPLLNALHPATTTREGEWQDKATGDDGADDLE